MIVEFKASKFNSLEEFINWTDRCPNYNTSAGWSGAKTYEDAVSIARNGVDLGRVESQLHKLEHSRPTTVQVMDVSGSNVNMEAYLSGEPENMFDFPVMEEPTKFINLFVDVTEHFHVSADEMVNKAIAIASVIDSLENNGYRISITVGAVTCFDKSFQGHDVPGNTALLTAIKIKDYHHPMSIGQLTGCCHPSFLRKICFRHFEGHFQHVGGVPPGIGRSASMVDIQKVLEENFSGQVVYVPNSRVAGGDLTTVETALEMVQKYISI